jgi:hypothetical protein
MRFIILKKKHQVDTSTFSDCVEVKRPTRIFQGDRLVPIMAEGGAYEFTHTALMGVAEVLKGRSPSYPGRHNQWCIDDPWGIGRSGQ